MSEGACWGHTRDLYYLEHSMRVVDYEPDDGEGGEEGSRIRGDDGEVFDGRGRSVNEAGTTGNEGTDVCDGFIDVEVEGEHFGCRRVVDAKHILASNDVSVCTARGTFDRACEVDGGDSTSVGNILRMAIRK